MAEQYVYNRSKSERGSFSGFISRTEGIVGAVQKEIQAMALRELRIKNGRGEYIPVWEKRTLSGRQDKVVLQKTICHPTSRGMEQQSSGYVLDTTEELLSKPACWGGLDYQIKGDEPISLAPQPITLEPLYQVLDYFSMTPEQFLHLIKSCFDARFSSSMTLIGVDFSRKRSLYMGTQLLLWIYSFLPFAMRRELNCTTCFNGDLNSGFQLGLAPMQLLNEEGDHAGAGFRRGFLAGGGVLFEKGTLVYDAGVCRLHYAEQNGIYSQWLRSVIGQIVKLKNRAQKALPSLDVIYRREDEMIRSLPEEDRCSPNYYDALSWNLLRKGAIQQGESRKIVPSQEDLLYYEDFLAFGSWPEVIDALGDILDALEYLYSSPASTRIIRLLTKILQMDGAEENLNRAGELLSAFLSRDMEVVEADESSAVSARYLQLMTANGMERPEALQILSRSFFPSAYPVPKNCDYEEMWERIGTSRQESEGLRRCNDWMSSYVNVCINAEELVDCGETVIHELDGLVPRLLKRALDCLLGAQETRCYYAKMDILPSHLTACLQEISQVRSMTNELYRPVITGYYSSLLSLLYREYAICWAGKSTLVSICSLADTFRQEGWLEQNWDYLHEMILTQCADICDYDWDQLKLQFKREDSAILQRLWQVVDLLDEFHIGEDMKNLLTRQVCRYIIHCVPRYVNDNWIVCEVRERDDLERKGYYLEMLTLRDFFHGKEQTLERLQKCIKRNHVPEELMKDMTKFIYRVFQQGGLGRLDLVAVEGIYIASRDRLKISQVEVFRTICRIRGGKALIQILSYWPSAQVSKNLAPRKQKKVESAGRKGAYPWLKTNKSLMDSLLRLCQDKETMALAAEGDRMFYLSLAEAVNELAPVGTVARPMAIQINSQLLTLQEEQADPKVRMKCNARRRQLLSK